MKLSINKDSAVPVRDQLVEQIGLQIASGILKEKDKLPSIRALAQRLGIHHSTVTSAYNHLADVGLLEIRQGSGVRVASTGHVRGTELSTRSVAGLLRTFLAQAAESGFSRNDLREHLLQMLDKTPVQRILVVDRNVDFHAVLLAELQPHFKLPVQPITHEQLDASTDLLADSFVLTTIYHAFPLQNMPIDPTRVVVCAVEPGRDQMDVVLALPKTSLLVFVSASNTMLRMAQNMTAALRGEEISVRTLTPSDETEIRYILQYAKAIICDLPSQEVVTRIAGSKVPVHVFRLYSDTTLSLIKDRLEKWG